MGPTLATEVLITSELKDEFELVHLDTSDHRPLNTLGAIDFTNIYLAVKSYVELLWLLIMIRPNLVYIPISQTTLGYMRDSVYILLSRLFGRRVVCHLRGGNFRNWLTQASMMTRWYVWFVHRMVHCQIVLGHCLTPLFAGILPSERICVVPNGKDIEFPEVTEGNDAVMRVLFLSNMRRAKGVLDVLHAIPLVLDHHSNVEFMFAGAWSELDVQLEVEAFANEHTDYPIKLLGSVKGDDKLRLLASSDIFVLPSYYQPEGHPWVLVEAMAAGLPIIATDQGAITESVRHGENGFIVEKRSPAEVADRLKELLASDGKRGQMGLRSRQFYERDFTEEQMIRLLSAAFRTALSG